MTLRVCVWNVHSWLDTELTPRADDVIELLGGINCDVVMLNEVPEAAGELRRVAEALGMNAAYAPAQFAGNALLARAPLEKPMALGLPTRRGETRSAVIADVVIAGERLTLASLHLDHRREVARLEQLAGVHAELERRRVNADGLIVGGDFNALRLTDHPPNVREAVRAHRAANGWEPPAGNVVARMDSWGFIDAARLADAGSLAKYPEALDRPIAPALASTCWAGTRIDYLWLSASVAAKAQRVDAVVADVDVSDHRPLVITLH